MRRTLHQDGRAIFYPRLAALCLAMVAAACASSSGTTSQWTAPIKMPVPIDDSPVTGPSDAWVTVVEFADFQCSYCGKAAPTVDRVLADHPLDVRVA